MSKTNQEMVGTYFQKKDGYGWLREVYRADSALLYYRHYYHDHDNVHTGACSKAHMRKWGVQITEEAAKALVPNMHILRENLAEDDASQEQSIIKLALLHCPDEQLLAEFKSRDSEEAKVLSAIENIAKNQGKTKEQVMQEVRDWLETLPDRDEVKS